MKCKLCSRKVKFGCKFCNKHYFEQRSLSQPFCCVDGCDTKAFSKGYCKKHYMRMHRYGSLNGKERISNSKSLIDEYNFFREVYNNAVGTKCLIRIRNKLLTLEQQAIEMNIELHRAV